MGNPFDHWSHKEVEEVLELPELIPDRYSSLFVRQLKDGASGCHPKLDVSKLIAEIKHLELGDESRNKPASQYTGPLSPLWHKHYTPLGIDVSSKNLINAHKPMMGKNAYNKIKAPLEKCANSEDEMNQILDAIICSYREDQLNEVPSLAINMLETRYRNSQGTGEWIIYAIYNEQNYYLCLAKHSDRDDETLRLIQEHCVKEFPFLKEILKFAF